MKLTKELASEILTGLDSGSFEQRADEPAKGDEDFQEMVDAVAELTDKHGAGAAVALADYIKDVSEDVRAHEVDDFFTDNFKGSGRSKGKVLKEYAEQDAFDLGNLFSALDRAGAVDWFDWDGYVDSGQGPTNDLYFYEIPTTGDIDQVYLFSGC